MARPTVLVVDDEGCMLFGLGHSLRGLDLRLLFASSAEDALALLAEERVDVVVSDYQMPGTNGLALLRDVADWYPDTVRIMITGHADLAVATEAINQQLIFRLLLKPYDRAQLEQAVRDAIAWLGLERRSRRLLAQADAGLIPAGRQEAARWPQALAAGTAGLDGGYADWPDAPPPDQAAPRRAR